MLKIDVGSKLTFTKDDSIICEVYDNKKVKYNNKIYSLSSLSRDILHKYFNWKSNYVNGFGFWKYDDEILTKRRIRLEKNEE